MYLILHASDINELPQVSHHETVVFLYIEILTVW